MSRKTLCTISLTKEESKKASLIAALEQITRPELIRRQLLNYLDQHPQKSFVDKVIEEGIESAQLTVHLPSSLD